jgi:hypothetical protein
MLQFESRKLELQQGLQDIHLVVQLGLEQHNAPGQVPK